MTIARLLIHRESTRRNLVAFFISFSMCVTYFFCVRQAAFGVQGNSTNMAVFGACSTKMFHLAMWGDVWKGRLAGLKITGMIFDHCIQANQLNGQLYANWFAMYHTVWLFLLFSLLLISFQNGIFINGITFAGLLYNFTPGACLYFYPWDLPATFFFTLAAILFSKQRFWRMTAAICIGCLFKETVLCCTVLALFIKENAETSATKNIWPTPMNNIIHRCKIACLFLLPFIIYATVKKIWLHHLGFHTAIFSMATNNTEGHIFTHQQIEFLQVNMKSLFSANWNHVIFINAGTILAVMLFGWNRRLLPFMVVITAYMLGNTIWGKYGEFHDLEQILPLSIIVLCEKYFPERL